VRTGVSIGLWDDFGIRSTCIKQIRCEQIKASIDQKSELLRTTLSEIDTKAEGVTALVEEAGSSCESALSTFEHE
jgi:hypothetical protein